MRAHQYLIAFAAILLLGGCQRKTEPAGQPTKQPTTSSTAPASSFEGCKTGTKLGADGHVAEEKTSFAVNEPIHLTIGHAQATPRQQITVEVVDSKGEEIKTLWKWTDGETIVTMPLRNLAPERYTAKTTWGKDKLCEQRFEVR